MNFNQVIGRIAGDLAAENAARFPGAGGCAWRLVRSSNRKRVYEITLGGAGARRAYFVKVTDDPETGREIAGEYALLKRAYPVMLSSEGCRVPRPVAYHGDCMALVTEKSDGIPLDAHLRRGAGAGSRVQLPRQQKQLMARCAQWLRLFHGLADADPQPVISHLFLSKIERNIDVLKTSVVGRRCAERLRDVYGFLLAHRESAMARHCVMHGDFCPPNILVLGDSICVLDLSYVRKEVVQSDISYFMLSLTLVHPLKLLRSAGRRGGEGLAQEFKDRYFQRTGGETRQDAVLLRLYSLLHLTTRMRIHFSSAGFSVLGPLRELLAQKHYYPLLERESEYLSKNIGDLNSPV